MASVPLAPGSLVVHCAASGLQYPPLVPIWGPDKIRLQTIRAGFPCFCAALAGYVEATRDDDRERNRLCPPNTLPDSPANWARMQVRGTLAARAYGAEPDIAAWANGCALNPARIEPVAARRPCRAGRRRPPGRRRRARASLGWPSSPTSHCRAPTRSEVSPDHRNSRSDDRDRVDGRTGGRRQAQRSDHAQERPPSRPSHSGTRSSKLR